MTKIAVTGIGIISSIGDNVEQTYNSLVNKKSGIGPVEILQTKHKDEFKVGEIKHSNDRLIQILNVNPDLPWTRTALIGLIACKQAIEDSGISADKDTALISATTVGGMDQSERHYYDMLSGKHMEYVDTHHAGNSTEMIAQDCGIGGIVSTISTACSSSLNSILFGSRLIKNGLAKKVIAGGTDSLSRFTLNGFNTLMILDRDHCRPFDSTRTGLNLGEGAAYLVLEDYEDALKEGKKIYAIVSGYANANDAHHQTASSDNGEGPFLSMKNALLQAGLKPVDIDYINAHGTGTENNDLTESIALTRLFSVVPPFSSTKAYTGHTLGAAGAVEAIISILALNHNLAFPNINFNNKIEEVEISPVNELTELEKVSHVLTNSFGFGGNDSSLIFSDPDSFVEKEKPIDSKRPIYISGAGCVSPQKSLEGFLKNRVTLQEGQARFEIDKPNYRDYIDPRQLRRMSKIIRMGMVSASVAMQESAIDKPDAIITGTGMGCQRDTEKFLNSMIENDEGLLTPTSFIQSTHNTVGGSIALAQKNHNYNLTYVHRTFSFESALLDGILLLKEGVSANVLVGGFDEITEESWKIKSNIGHYKPLPPKNGDMLNDDQAGALSGEGSAFFVLSAEQNKSAYARVSDVHIFMGGRNIDELSEIDLFLKRNGYSSSDIDIVLMGRNGDKSYDVLYDKIESSLFEENAVIDYKLLSGEYDTSASFAMWFGAEIIKANRIPEFIQADNYPENIKTVLIYNQFRGVNHSLILLER